ncbi:MAG: hypothetical protein E7089_05370 [Bacteroidales bacterium]|nr:hypothetical protein [Bacteroidales bacterium]
MNDLINFREKFDVLKATKEQSSMYELFKKSCDIKNAILKNSTITLECATNSELSNIRKNILNDIKQFQKSIKDYVLSVEDDSENVNYATITDFKSAKKELAELITQEEDLNIYDNDNNSGFLNLKEIPGLKKHEETLNIVKESCEKSKYTVLMIGEYQSGKTTTLEAICEGRHINAIGTGNATSAVPMYVSYSEKENFNIEWKSKERLKQIFTYLIEVFDDFKYQEFDLDNEETRKTWLSKIEELRNSNSCPPDIKQIAICSLLLKYYKTKELDEFVNNITNSHIPSITKFPDEINQRWKNFGSDNFKIEESLFIFVEQVNYYCPSTILKDLNCTFIDCPGLFNNSYDTEITNKILANVNAIMYLLPYEKGFGKNVNDSIYKIKNHYKDVHRKLFIAQNLSLIKDNLFIEDNCDKIRNMFGEKKEVVLYDAHLAYLGQTLYSYNHNLLSSEDVSHFCKPVEIKKIKEKTEIEFKDFDEAFKYHIKSYLDIIESSEFPPKAEAIINASNFNELITKLQEFINENEAYSIIVGEGVDKLSSELTSLRTTLYTSHIEPYFAGKEKIESLWENRLSKAETFQTTVSNIKEKILFGNNNNRGELSKRLTEEVYKKLFTNDFYNDLFGTISDTIYNNRTKITAYMGIRGFDKQAFKNFITPLINKEIFELINGRIKYWHNILKTGQDQDFANIFTPRMKELEVTLKDEWRELFYDYDNKNFQLHNYISLHPYIEDYYKDMNNNIIGQSYGHFGSTVSQIAIPATIVAEIGVIVGSIAAMVSTAVAVLFAVGFLNPIGWGAILVGGPAIALSIATRGKEWVRKEFKKLFKSELSEVFYRENIYSKFTGIIETQINVILKKCNETISLNIEKMKMERDIATSLSEEDSEKNCIEAVDAISTINQQLRKYKDFKEKHVIYEEA